MSIKETALTFALKKAIADVIAAEVGDDRSDVFKALKALYDETRAKSITINLPGGEKVATITLPEPKPRYVVDDPVFLDWLKDNRPDLVETIEHPAQGAWTEERIDPKALAALDAKITPDGELVTEDGVEVDGVTVDYPEPKTFTVTYTREGKEDVGRARLIEAWKAGRLEGIDAGHNLPEITQ